jgi:hypothetical protein
VSPSFAELIWLFSLVPFIAAALTHKVLDMASMAIEKAELFLRDLTLKS